MNAYRLDAETLLVPMRAEADDGTVGDGLVVSHRGEPGYAAWEPFAVDPDPELLADLRAAYAP